MKMAFKLMDKDKQLVEDYYVNVPYDNTDKFEIASFYTKYSEVYDEAMKAINFNANSVQLVDYVKRHVQDPSNSLVIDIAAGPGEIGVILASCGFKNIHALDMTKAFIDMCAKKNVYSKLFHAELKSTPTVGIEKNTYDAAISSGAFVPGHIPMEALEELTRIVKPQGYIMYTLYDPTFKMDYMEAHGRFMKEKKLELVSMTLEPYKRECLKNYELVFAYYVVFRVL